MALRVEPSGNDPSPVEGVYPFPAAGEPIPVYRGPAVLGREDVPDLDVWMPLDRKADVLWSAKVKGLHLPGETTIRLDRPELGDITVDVRINHSHARGFVPGSNLSAGEPMQCVVAHWLNIPMLLPTGPLQNETGDWLGRWTTSTSDWTFTLDSRPDHAETLREVSERRLRYAVTHVSHLRRTDDEVFDSDTAWHVLHGFQIALSFALGRWVAPALPVGMSPDGRRVWEQWASWRCNEFDGYESWFDTFTADDLADFVSSFMDAYLDDEQHAVVRHFAHHVIAANHSGTTTEARVMLAQAAIEYLGWVDLVLSGSMSKTQHRKLSAEEVLRTLLESADIPCAVPDDLDAAVELATSLGTDGPGVVSWLRNRLVHPKNPQEPYELSQLLWQTSQLLLEYCELLLLRRLAYHGKYMRRFPPNRWAHDSQHVPWATGETHGTT